MREDTYVARFLIMFVFVVSFLLVLIECANTPNTAVPKRDMFLALAMVTFLVGCASWLRLRRAEKEEKELEGQRPYD